MIDQQLREAIAAAPSGVALDNLARLVWRGHAEGLLGDDAAQALGEAVEARRALFRAGAAFRSTKAASGPRRPPRSPDRVASIERRRRVAAAGAMPPALAARFTTGEQAALAVIAGEVRRRGRCELPIDALAAMAGVSRSTVKNAVREAGRLGLLVMVERRRRGRPSDTNVITIVDAAWQSWLRLRERRGQNVDLHEYQGISRGSKPSQFAGQKPVPKPRRPRLTDRLVSERQSQAKRA